MLLFSDLGELTYNELFQDPKTEACWCTLENKRVQFILFSVDFSWLYYSKIGYGHATNGVMTQQEVKCTPNNQCKCIVSMKTRYAYYV